MLVHKATKKNIEILRSYGNHILDAPMGELASGLTGEGRMSEPEDIVKEIRDYFSKKKILSL
jgi:phosphopantothenoylcysteine decarboxylase/phosphopantothenate--cysteine ligase